MVHDTGMAQFIPPTLFHEVTGTWTLTAGTVSGTISAHKAAAAETSVINIPITIPQNAVALKGGYLKSVTLDYEIQTAAATSITASMNKVTRGANITGLSVAAVTVTQDLVAAVGAASIAKHKLTVTLTTPVWLLNTEYILLVITAVCALTTLLDLEGAVALFTERL